MLTILSTPITPSNNPLLFRQFVPYVLTLFFIFLPGALVAADDIPLLQKKLAETEIPEDRLEILEDLHIAFTLRGDSASVEQARQYATQYMAAVQKEPLGKEDCRWHYMAGRYFILGRQADSALYHQKKAFILASRQGKPERVLDASRRVCRIFMNFMQEVDSASKWADKGLKWAEDNGVSDMGSFRLMTVKGQIELAKGNYDNATSILRQALALAEKLEMPEREKGPTYRITAAAMSQGDHSDSAVVFFYKALKGYQLAGNKEGIYLVYGSLGQLLRMNGDFQRALETDLAKLEMAKHIANPSRRLHTEIQLVFDYLELDSAEKAYQYLASAGELVRKLGGDRDLGYFYYATAFYEVETGQFDAARAHIARSVSYLESGGFGDLINSLEELFLRLEIKTLESLPTNQARTYIRQPVIFGDADLIAFCFRMKKIHTEQEHLPILINICELMAVMQAVMGNHKKAYTFQKRQMELKATYLSQEKSLLITRLEKKFEQAEKEKALAEEQLKNQEHELKIQHQQFRLISLFIICSLLGFSGVLMFAGLRRKHREAARLSQKNQELASTQEKILAQNEFIEEQNLLLEARQKELSESVNALNQQLTSQLIINQNVKGTLQNLSNRLKSLKNRLPEENTPELNQIMKDIRGQLNRKESWEAFKVQFEQVHPDFFSKLLAIHPNLTRTDLRFCAYLYLGMSYKEIMGLLNLTMDGVESARYRINRKMGLEKGAKLQNYLMTFQQENHLKKEG